MLPVCPVEISTRIMEDQVSRVSSLSGIIHQPRRFLGVILSERSESKDPYSCEKSQCSRVAEHRVWDCWRPKGSFDSSLRSSLRMTHYLLNHAGFRNTVHTEAHSAPPMLKVAATLGSFL